VGTGRPRRDHLSNGRVQLSVGLGALHPGWLAFERDEGRRIRAEKLDEGLAVYDGLMRGQPFAFRGQHYEVHPVDFMPPPAPVQRPRVPVWVVGAHPSRKSLRRAALYDGLLATKVGLGVDSGDDTAFQPSDLAEVAGAVRVLREEAGMPWAGYDVIAEGISTPDSRGDAAVQEWADAGATWWIESDWSGGPHAVARHRTRIDAGPPLR
jgi:hypothetical protein